MTWGAIFSQPGLQAIIGLSFILLLALIWGGIHNRRLGQRVLQALTPLQPRLGKHLRITWQGSSGFSAAVEEPQAPFRELTLAARLLPRETLPALWVLLWLAGRRDVLQITGTLQAAPRAQARLGQRRASAKEGWQTLHSVSGLPAALRGGDAEQIGAALRPLTEPSAARLVRLSLMPITPHVRAEVALGGLDQARLAALLANLSELCQTAARPPD